MKEKKTGPLTPQQALLKAANYCAYQERCHDEVRNKLSEWGVWGTDADEVVLKLIEQNYLNEERFARAYAGGKFRTQHWGRIKIKLELKARHISDYCIRAGMQEISDKDYHDTLQRLASQKWKETKDTNPLSKRNKVARYLAGKGFEQDLTWEVLREITG